MNIAKLKWNMVCLHVFNGKSRRLVLNICGGMTKSIPASVTF